MIFVPVVDSNQNPLMPTIPSRARRWIRSGKATPFWKRGIFCVRLNQEPSGRNMQDVAVGIDPGSKKEGFTVKSEAHTYLNIQTDAVTWVKQALKTRREMRRARRFRSTPCRQPRFNLAKGGIPPSTKARWQWKLRICNWLRKMFPITNFVVEDIKVQTQNGKNLDWNRIFSPLMVGKKWFYSEVQKLGNLTLILPENTYNMRQEMGLEKVEWSADMFESHCQDSWVLANSCVGGHTKPDNKEMLLITPLRFHRRQLHALQPTTGGVRRLYGGTRSLGFKRGSLVKHPTFGLTYVGGTSKNRISLHSLADGQRLCQNARLEDCKFLTFNSWRTRLLPALKDGVSAV